MRLESLRIDDILIEESPYNLRTRLITEVPPPWPENLTPLPVIVLEENGRFHLLDGLRRVSYLRGRGADVIKAIVFQKTSPSELCRLIYSLHHEKINQSTIQKVLFMDFALCLGCPLEDASGLVGLRGYRNLKEELQRILSLPPPVREFFHRKGFSYLQILSFTVYPLELVEFLVGLSGKVQITAQVFEELLQGIHECMKRDDLSLEDLKKALQTEELLETDLPPKRKAEVLRQRTRQLRFPFLEGVNRQIEQRIQRFNLPSNIQILWDRTLEEAFVEVRIRIDEPQAVETLRGSDRLRHVLEAMKEVSRLVKEGRP